MLSPTDDILLAEPPPAPLPPSSPPPDFRLKVQRHLRARRAAFRAVAVRAMLALLGSVAFGLIVADVWFGLTEQVRWVAWGALGVSGWAMLWRWWWRPAGAFGELEAARDLERGFPVLGQRLRTAREVQSAWAYRGDDPIGQALLHETRTRMAELDPRRLISRHRSRLLLLACLLLGIGYVAAWRNWAEFPTGAHRLFTPWKGYSYTTVEILNPAASFIDKDAPHLVARISGRPAPEATLFCREEGAAEWKPIKMARAGDSTHFDTVLAGRKKSLDYYVTAGDGRSPQYHLRCLLTPKIERVHSELKFPDYTGLAVKQMEGGDVRVVEGTEARVVFTLNTPLKSISATTSDGRSLPLVAQGTELSLNRTLTRGEVTWRLTGESADGLALAPVTYKFVGLEDKVPEVQLVEPAKDVSATSVWEILARVRAKDDFGVAEVGILLVVGEDLKLITQRKITEKNVREVDEMGTAMLEGFPLTINDNLKIYAYARDHKPRDGARSVSNLRAIDIRQFKTRYMFLKPEELEGLAMSGEQFQRLGDLIELQRAVVSDAFMLKENGVPEGEDLGRKADEIREREDQLAARVQKLARDVGDAGTMNRDQLVLLDTAAQQMTEASKALTARQLRAAYKQADRALSSLLQMRELVMRLETRSKNAQPANGAPEPDNGKTLSDLAREAERLAREEHDVREQVSPELRRGLKLGVTRHQQQVAVTDAGELFAALVAHPETTELALQRMDRAEKAMQTAEGTLDGEAPQDAGPSLNNAEDALLELASQLRALDKKNLPNTLQRLAEQAAIAQEQLKQEQERRESAQNGGGAGEPQVRQDARQQDPTEAKADAQSGQSSQADSAGTQGKTAQNSKSGQAAEPKGEGKDAAGKNSGEKAGDAKAPGEPKTSGQGKEPGNGEQVGDEKKGRGGKNPAEGAASGGGADTTNGNGASAKGIENGRGSGGAKADLGKLAEQADTIDDVLKNLGAAKDAGAKGQRLQELRDEAGTKSLGESLRRLGQGDGSGPSAGELAEQFGKLAEGLSREERRLLQSNIEKLTDAQNRSNEMLKNGGKAPRENEKPSETKGGDSGEKNKGGKTSPSDAAEAQKPADAKGAGTGGTGNGQPGDGERRAEQEGGKGGSPQRNHSADARVGRLGGQGLGEARYLHDIEDFEDDGVTKLLKPLEEDLVKGAFDPKHLRAVNQRLQEMIDDLLRINPSGVRDDRVPDQYSHMVDEYYRALSDDLGGAKPKQK